MYLKAIMQIVSNALKTAKWLEGGGHFKVYQISKNKHLLVQIHSFEILQNQRCPIFRSPKSACWNEQQNSE